MSEWSGSEVAAYKAIWWGLVGALVAGGGVVALVLVPVGAWVTIFVFAGLVTGLIAASWLTSRALLRRVFSYAAMGGTAAVAITGLYQLVGGGALALAAMFAAGSPAVVRRLLRRHRVHPTTTDQLADISSASLCRAWQDSFDALRITQSPAARLRIVEARQRYLDELERRDPDGLHAWLESNASPAGDPARFVADREPFD